jgi:hypothetical protein
MDQQDANLRNMLQLGIKAAQAKRKTEAYQLLSQVVRRDPRSEQGWLWLAAVAPHPQESLDAFNHVLAINPSNEQARVGQRWASARLTAPPAAPVAPAPAPAAGSMSFAPSAPPPAPSSGFSGFGDTGYGAGDPFAAAAANTMNAAGNLAVEMPADPFAQADPFAMPAAPTAAPAAEAWRASGDLAVPASNVDWDDSGLDLDGLNNLDATLDDVNLDPSLRGVSYTPSALTAPTKRDLPADRTATGRTYTESLLPVQRRSNLMPLILGALLLVGGLFLLVSAFTTNRGQLDRPAQQFFQAYLDGKDAGGFLTGTLQNTYMASKNDLPALNLKTTLAGTNSAMVEPPATLVMSREPDKDGSEIESYITIRPTSKPPIRYLVHLTRVKGSWLVDSILPATPPAASAP